MARCEKLLTRSLSGIVGSIDGIAIKIVKPRRIADGVINPMNCYNRKCFFALNVLCVHCRFE